MTCVTKLPHDSNGVNTTKMFGKVENVTPAMATAWLESMPSQRLLREKRVKCYIEDALSGRWVLHHQGIGFDCEGRLRDGQHRLTVIVRTGMTLPLFVVRNVPVDSFVYVDGQLPRSIRDALRMAEKGDFSHSQVAVARMITSLPTIKDKEQVISNEIILDRLRLWSNDIAFACERMDDIPGLTRSCKVLVARAHATFSQDQDKVDRLDEWCEALRTGLVRDVNTDSAAITFRNLLLTLSRLSNAGTRVEQAKYHKGQTALTSFMKYQPMRKIYGTEVDLFPVPDDRVEAE